MMINFLSGVEDFLIAHEKLLTILLTLAIAWFTRTLYVATKGLQIAAIAQGDDMKKSLEISTTSVRAMESVAEATRSNALLMQAILHKQMRAYIAVDIGKALYQDENTRFEADPVLVNTGFTPARNVRHQIKADILPMFPELGELPDPGELRAADATLAPRQTFVAHGIVNHRFAEDEVALIKKGEQKRLMVWGSVFYEDVFGGSWRTNFCHTFVFVPEGEGFRQFGFFYSKHNDAT